LNIFKKVFGFKEKRDTTPNIEMPKMPQETVSGKRALDLLMSRSRGEGVGFSPEQLNQMFGTSTAINRFQREDLPELEGLLGAANISKTPQGVGLTYDARQSAVDRARDILANRQFQNMQVQQGGIENALSGLQNFSQQELKQSNAGIAQKFKDYERQIGERDAREDANYKAMSNVIDTFGGSLASDFFAPTQQTSSYADQLEALGMPTDARLARSATGGSNSMQMLRSLLNALGVPR